MTTDVKYNITDKAIRHLKILEMLHNQHRKVNYRIGLLWFDGDMNNKVAKSQLMVGYFNEKDEDEFDARYLYKFGDMSIIISIATPYEHLFIGKKIDIVDGKFVLIDLTDDK